MTKKKTERPDDEAILARIARIEADSRWQAGQKKPALVEVNAPLALIQVALDTERRTLRWVLGQ